MPSTSHQPGAPEDIAVVGMACLFPGAPDLATFWRNIVSKTSAITSPPPEAWNESRFFEAGSDANYRVYCRKGGFLGPLAFFDPLEHGIMPRAAEGGEPDQWLALHVARQALLDAGYVDGGADRRRSALILGKGTYANRGTISVVYHGLVIDATLDLLRTIHPELTESDLAQLRDDLRRRLPRFDAETAPALIPNVTVGRIANRLDLMGPSYTIDAACASSLVAIDLAVKGLRHGEYDLALVGGMQVATPVPVLSLFCQLGALSPTESIRPFDKDADGTLLSEGVGMAVLKRRSDAERDGDRIYAVVKGTGVASDGRAVGVLAPRVEGEELAVRQAYESSGVPPRTVGLVEAHGTATLVGDATELEALRRVFGEREGLPRCALGSVKSMIGHTMPAAGMAGFIKAALSLYHNVLPPTLGVTEPSPRLQLERTPFYVNSETRPWIHGDQAHPRRAAVNAFGFGGINAHVILEASPGQPGYVEHEIDRETELFLLAGGTRPELIETAQAVLAAIGRSPALRPADLAFTLNTRFEASNVRPVVVGIVAASLQELSRKLERALARLADPACHKIKDVSGIYFFEEPLSAQGRLAFLFPGEGAQYVGMLGDLCRYFPEVRAAFDEMDGHFVRHPRGFVLSDLVFPPPAFSDAERAQAERRLWDMDAAVEEVYTANHALTRLLGSFGIRPDAILGHSTGEYSAMRAAGLFDEQEYESKVHELNRIYGGAASDGRVPIEARLIAVGASRERVAAVCAPLGESVCIAMDNCRHQVVVVAPPALAEEAEHLFTAEGFLFERLRFDRPYHTPYFAEFAERLRAFTDGLIVRPPTVTLYSATSAGAFPHDLAGIRQLAYEHWLKPVEFRRTIERMYDDGIRIFVEVGPRGNLTAFVDDILARRTYAAIPANVSRRSGITQIHHLLAQLAAHGVPFSVAPLYSRRAVTSVDLDRPAAPEQGRSALRRVKIPTGAPELRLSPEMVDLVRARAGARVPGTRPQAPVSQASAADVRAGDAAAVADPTAAAPHAAEYTTANVPAPPVGAETAGAMGQPPAAGVPPAVAASHVMSAFFGTMGRFLDVQQELMGVHPDGASPSPGAPGTQAAPEWEGGLPAAAAAVRRPLVETVVSHVPGRELVAHCTLDVERFPCLLDHTLGRNLSSEDPTLTAFPIVPFTLLAEIMAQAAAVLVPTGRVVGMRNVRVYRFVALDRAPVTLEIRATALETADVAVRLRQVGGAREATLAEGVILVRDEYPDPPPFEPLEMADGQPCRWAAQDLYEEAMFHGPAFRGVVSVDRVGQAGAIATLAVLDRDRLVAGAAGGDFVTDFVLLDLPGQVVGFWTAQMLADGYVVLPFQMDALTLYGGLLSPGERLTCLARIALVGQDRVRASFDVLRADGRLWVRFEGWQDRRFHVPSEAVRLLLNPDAVSLSQRWTAPLGVLGSARFVARRLGVDTLPQEWLTAHGDLWLQVLATSVLSRREREYWHGQQLPPLRRLEWLFGRIAAKDAVREYARQHLHLVVPPADVEVLTDERGRPVVDGAWMHRVGRPLSVSISHVEGVAIALVGEGDGIGGVGVDLERLGRMRPATARLAFTDEERPFISACDPAEREAWSLRLWCAKEACAKAMGRGLLSGLRAFTVRAVDRQRGAVSVRFDAPGEAGEDLIAFTAQEGEWITASCAAAAREDIHI